MKKVAIVGCGRISKRHVEAIKATKGLELSVVCDIDSSIADKASKLYSVPCVYNYNDIQDVDIISILTPSGLHPMHVKDIVTTSSAQNIVCEKPISLTVREAYELYDHVDSTGKRFLPVYQNRYNPLVVLVKELIQSQKLGHLHQFVCNIFWNRNDDYFANGWHGTRALDGGVLYTQASHYVDMIHFFFGEISDSKGMGGSLRDLEVYDTITAACRFKNGVIGSINATISTFKQNFTTEFVLISEKGTIRLSGTNLNTIDFWDVDGIEKPNIDFKIDHIYGKGHNSLYGYITDEAWNMFPSRDDVISGIRLMERLSY